VGVLCWLATSEGIFRFDKSMLLMEVTVGKVLKIIDPNDGVTFSTKNPIERDSPFKVKLRADFT